MVTAPTPMNNNELKELQMGPNPNNTKSTGQAVTETERAPEAIEPSRSVANDAERVVNMPGNGTARRRAWWAFLFSGEAYMIVWIGASVVAS